MDRATNQIGKCLVSELRVTRVWGAEVASLGGLNVNHHLPWPSLMLLKFSWNILDIHTKRPPWSQTLRLHFIITNFALEGSKWRKKTFPDFAAIFVEHSWQSWKTTTLISDTEVVIYNNQLCSWRLQITKNNLPWFCWNFFRSFLTIIQNDHLDLCHWGCILWYRILLWKVPNDAKQPLFLLNILWNFPDSLVDHRDVNLWACTS